MHSPDPAYEYSEPITVAGTLTRDQSGGTQGTDWGIVLQSPFGSAACEWALQLAVFEASGTVSISTAGRPSVVGITNDGGVPGYMLKAANAAVIMPSVCFTPLKNGRVYVSIDMSSGNATLTFLFRRHTGHTPSFAPVFHASNPEHEHLVNQARAEAMASTEDGQVRQ